MPLLTVPYVSRVLGPAGVGVNAVTYANAYYFFLLGSIGITLYGNRQVAYVRENKDELSNTFWDLVSLRFITVIIAAVLFVVFANTIGKYRFYLLLNIPFVLSAAFDISWLFSGLEQFKKIVVRNFIVKAISVALIFLLVKSSGDLWLYVAINGVSQLVGNMTFWTYLKGVVKKIDMNQLRPFKHFGATLSLFIPQITIQIYSVLNKTILGYASTATQAGLFDNADKIIKIMLAVVTALGAVLLPRISNSFAQGDHKTIAIYIEKSFQFVTLMSIPIVVGLVGISQNFSLLFFGSKFAGIDVVLAGMSPVILLIAWSNVSGNQYLISVNKVRFFTISVITGAVVNFVLNLLLIPNHGAIGATVATLVAELVVTAVQFYFVAKDMKISKFFKDFWKFAFSGIFMYVILKLFVIFGGNFISTFVGLSVEVITGALAYGVALIVTRPDIFKFILEKILRKHMN